MEKEVFEKLVREGVDLIPEKFLAKMENVVLVVEDEPTSEQLAKVRLGKDSLLFGLYEGVPQTRRGPHYGMTLPDKITIFQKHIEQFAQGPEEVRQIVKNTVWHEIAHHFGSSEETLKELERKRREYK